jgi:NADPH:quinone reductase-like Zn-dependent oxidoreductase
VDDVDGLEILAVSLTPLDLAVGNGVFYGGHPPLPYVPGCEAVGRRGDGRLVYLFGEGRGVSRDGFLAERVDASPELDLTLPDDVDPALAAAAGIAGIAAWVPVAWKAKVGEGDRVLVLGGTGAVGRLAAQAAQLLGAAHVVAVGSKDLDRIGEEFADDGFTVCIDPVWGDPLADALRYAQRHARIVHVGQSAGRTSPLASADVRGKELMILGHSNFALSKDERDRGYLELLDHLVAGRITLAYETFELDDVAAAWEHQRGGKSIVVF